MVQDEVFRAGEGDNWYARNQAHLAHSADEDRICAMVTQLSEVETIASVCEVGCSNGWRLARLQKEIASLQRVAGSDISSRAIADGLEQWPALELAPGSADAPNLQGAFDVVIVSFVLHWVARERLAASICAIDSLVNDGGYLIVADFLPDRPCKRRYHHRQDVELFTYKQDYRAAFTGLGFYDVAKFEIFSHGGDNGGAVDEQDRAVVALLQKSMSAYALV